ncbi:MAG: HNH endonuclease [Desulfobulbus sp.]|nr:HNH endonuclease [Desulfobulbus sp.]
MATELTKEQFVEILRDPKITYDLDKRLFKYIYSCPNHEAAASVAGKALGYGGKSTQAPLNSEIGRLAKRIAKGYDIDFTVRSERKYKYWDLFFKGRNKDGLFIWMLKPNLIEALRESGIVAYTELDDDSEEQKAIQRAKPATAREIKGSEDRPLDYTGTEKSKTIKKNSSFAKRALQDAEYTCQVDSTHKTFITVYDVPYMEGHHLIPCTVDRSEAFMKEYKKNIDCVANIICICPTCHRAVHFGDENTKTEKIKVMFAKQIEKLKKVGINITEGELLEFYK